ncbi:MAG: radical SAM protein [Endomicrobiaceae bacterium]|jgi:MoaA/NifB/PqqE/SkfB family radical SAM enzyme|nr:radical SAM protein [Endomicrobiaceae bacterium]MDD3729772.1 radical SAM protein [Endomicrobiaceae bacterium]MDD4166022.1 radical SAM protein [Endomicrobiaceae bacterium]
MVDLELAKEKISKKMYAEALQSLTELHKNFPDNEDVIFHLGKCYFYTGKYFDAENLFQVLLNGSSLSGNIREYSKYYLAAVKKQQGKYNESIDILLNCQIEELHEKYIDVIKLIDDLISMIKEKKIQFNAGIFGVIDRYFTNRIIFENSGDLILNIMQTYNFSGQYKKTIDLYKKYYKKYSENVFLSNCFLNEYELAAHKTNLKSKPRNIMLILTNSCDLDCIMCYQNKNTVKNINIKLVNIVMNNLQYLENIKWQGGEVLALPYFKDILLKTLQFPKIKQTITSNFQNVGEDIIELILKNNINLIISIDSVVKETYEKIRVGANFDKLKENLEKVNYYITKYGSKINLQINFLIMKINYKEIPDIIEFAAKYGFTSVIFLKCITDDENLKIAEEHKKDIENYIKQANIKAQEYNIKIIDVFSEFNDAVCNGQETVKSLKDKKTVADKGLFCHLPWYEMTIQEDNAVKPHCTCGYAHLTNTDKYNNIYDIWNNEAMQEYRKQILKSDNGKCLDICRQISSDYRKNFNK